MAKVREIMSTECVTVAPTDTLFDAANKMKQHDIGFIPVVEGQKLMGVVTDRDLVIRGYAQKKPESAMIRDCVSSRLSTISPDADVEEAAKMMAREQIRRLPVVDNGNLVGVLAIGDLAVREMHDEKAGKALSEISESSKTLATNR
jgi:CBS domain-containing protein